VTEQWGVQVRTAREAVHSEMQDRWVCSTRPAAEIMRTGRTKVLCAHVTTCVCLVIYTCTTTHLSWVKPFFHKFKNPKRKFYNYM